jgi:hypothetical protein
LTPSGRRISNRCRRFAHINNISGLATVSPKQTRRPAEKGSQLSQVLYISVYHFHQGIDADRNTLHSSNTSGRDEEPKDCLAQWCPLECRIHLF